MNNSVLSSLGDDPSLEKSLTVPLDETRPKKTEIPPRSDPDLSIQVDDSFAALNTRKKLVQQLDEEVMDKSGLNTSQNSAESDKVMLIANNFHDYCGRGDLKLSTLFC